MNCYTKENRVTNEIKGAWLTVNRICNLKCQWCYARNANEKRTMDFDAAINHVDLLAEMGVGHVTLIGGEPTMYSRLFELIRYIRTKQMTVGMATNGLRLSDINYAKELVSSGITGINISIKGINEDEYRTYTGKEGLGKAICAFHNLEQLNFRSTLSYVITEYNEVKIDSFIKMLEDNELDRIIFQYVKPVLEEKNNPIMPLNEMAMSTQYIFERLKNSSLNYKIEASYPLCLIENNLLTTLMEEKKLTTCCHVQAGRGIVFDTDFNVLPCNHFIDMPFVENTPVMKNLVAIENFWHSDEVQKFRNVARKYPAKTCIDCDLWNVCGGGCFTRWFYLNPDDYCIGSNR